MLNEVIIGRSCVFFWDIAQCGKIEFDIFRPRKYKTSVFFWDFSECGKIDVDICRTRKYKTLISIFGGETKIVKCVLSTIFVNVVKSFHLFQPRILNASDIFLIIFCSFMVILPSRVTNNVIVCSMEWTLKLVAYDTLTDGLREGCNLCRNFCPENNICTLLKLFWDEKKKKKKE